jgi:hypothetical protein
MNNDTPSPLPASRSPLSLTLWLVVCVWLNGAGWLLSSLHCLNRAGYAVAVGGLGLFCAWLIRRQRWKFPPRRRWRRALPAAWLALAALVWLGGLLHAPNNYDALAYRVPRVLHWLAEGRWEWIHTDFTRLNARAAGFEWLMAPVMALLRSERWSVLFNLTAFLLMPGLSFSVWRRLGMRPRVAWAWMWVLPGGYGFALQAGGLGNDFVGAVVGLMTMHFALRFRDGADAGAAVGALVAGGLFTGLKLINVPLLLPAALVLLPVWRRMFARPLLVAGGCVVGLLVSIVPISVLNWKYCGDWTGVRYDYGHMASLPPQVTIPGNAVILLVQNFVPPIMPLAKQWNEHGRNLLPTQFREDMDRYFEANGADLSVSELQNEEGAGLGFGVSWLVVLTMLAGWCCRTRGAICRDRWLVLVRWSAWVSLLYYMARSGVGAPGRLLIPYYPLLLVPLLVGSGAMRVVEQVWWRRAAVGTLALAALLLILTPSRPLWPARTVSAWLKSHNPGSRVSERIYTVYDVYSSRADALAPLREALPAGESVFGLVTWDDPEASLWRPFGVRRFHHVIRTDTPADLLAKGVQTVAVNAAAEQFEMHMGRPFEQWRQEMHGEVLATFTLHTRAASPPWDWKIVRLKVDAGKATVMP